MDATKFIWVFAGQLGGVHRMEHFLMVADDDNRWARSVCEPLESCDEIRRFVSAVSHVHVGVRTRVDVGKARRFPSRRVTHESDGFGCDSEIPGTVHEVLIPGICCGCFLQPNDQGNPAAPKNL